MPRNIQIGKVTLQGGTLDFTDRFIKPSYSARMLQIGGSVTGLSSEEISRAAIDLKGNLGHGSPVEITGRINPLARDLYADVKLGFKNIELSPVTPYSSRYVGHPILKGKLTFDVAYRIEKRKLDARNQIFLDQLTFGERVDSPDAIKAPVTLAVSLLADRNGRIQLDIPISGSLDDPEFELWPILWKILGNLIAKAVTAPFSLLASLVGGGEELSYIEFEAGSDLLTPEGKDKAQSVAKVLFERPGLKMDIVGQVDRDRDKDGLKRAELQRRITAQKLKDLARKSDRGVGPEQAQVQPGEYEKYLTAAYRSMAFPKPRNAIGIIKSLPAPEMEKLMLAHIDVTDSDLRQLAARRAERVKEFILQAQDIASGRIFVLEPGSHSPRTNERARESRVDFILK
ncbi:MAG: hypothetical protein A4E73_00816 [Syntrophaceae bacterium PtaU1.Bin231]|nr:MAG: hypothetical protein A4E73_00816 [Syntrophaceae bacterium PtaU1.Bin231]